MARRVRISISGIHLEAPRTTLNDLNASLTAKQPDGAPRVNRYRRKLIPPAGRVRADYRVGRFAFVRASILPSISSPATRRPRVVLHARTDSSAGRARTRFE